MSDEVVIQVEDLWKKYRLGTLGTGTFRHDFNRWLHRLRGKPDPYAKVGQNEKVESRKQKTEIESAPSPPREERDGERRPGEVESRKQKAEILKSEKVVSPPQPFSVSAFQRFSISEDEVWALRDINFEVRAGEILGIIGRNGAGKSTLLKILSRVTAPTHGEIRVKGRIASLLEVGTGFHPELTGRENIFLNGAILGMTKQEIKRKFDEIIAFAEVEKYIDTPVKRYSSGMYVRLAFAVAAHLEPEILIIDEVLAVGDAQFQKKCLGKMGEAAKGGRTVLFVSHNMTAVQTLCTRVILIEQGKLALDAGAEESTAKYMRSDGAISRHNEWPDPSVAPGNDTVRIRSIRIEPISKNGSELITMKSPIRVETDYCVLRPNKTLHLTYHLLDQNGVTVLTTGSPARNYAPGNYQGTFRLPGELLNSGDYYLRLLIVENENQVTGEMDSIASFSVVDAAERELAWMGREPGVIQIILPWEIRVTQTSAVCDSNYAGA